MKPPQYETFLNRYKEAAILGDVQQPDAKIISTARIPGVHAGASPLIIIMLSTLTGFLFGLLAVLVLDQLDHHIRTPAQLQRIAPFPTLAMIGRMPKAKSTNIADFVLDHSHDVITEAVRSLRVRLFQQNDNSNSQILAVTSSLAGEGKTTTSLWLARLLAGSGASVLLIDGDLRRPALHALAGQNPAYSLCDVLLGRQPVEKLILNDTRAPNLSLLSSTVASQHDLEMLTPQLIQNLLTGLRQKYTHIIIDAPPYLPVAEAPLFLQAADKALFLVRWDYTPIDIVRTTVQQLIADKVKVAGFAITHVDLSAHALYRYTDSGTYFQRYRDHFNPLKKAA